MFWLMFHAEIHLVIVTFKVTALTNCILSIAFLLAFLEKEPVTGSDGLLDLSSEVPTVKTEKVFYGK